MSTNKAPRVSLTFIEVEDANGHRHRGRHDHPPLPPYTPPPSYEEIPTALKQQIRALTAAGSPADYTLELFPWLTPAWLEQILAEPVPKNPGPEKPDA